MEPSPWKAGTNWVPESSGGRKVFTARSEVLERIFNESREVLVRFRGFWMCGKVSQVMKGSESIGFKVQEVKISRMDQDVKMFPESKCCDICLNIV